LVSFVSFVSFVFNLFQPSTGAEWRHSTPLLVQGATDGSFHLSGS
jgi:hypothetical protein